MRKICLVNNYNYAHFLAECLDSIANQTILFDNIIIVDDGSNDESPQIIEKFCQKHLNAQSIFKRNNGQLSCFNACVPFVLSTDLVFFLDSDDIYPVDYLENVISKLELDCDFIYSNTVNFITKSEPPIVSSQINHLPSIQLSKTTELTKLTMAWIGSPTSAIAITGKLFLTIFPYPYETDWVTRADDVIVYGASLSGARKLFLQSVGVGYRIHNNNHFYGKKQTPDQELLITQALNRLLQFFQNKINLKIKNDYFQIFIEYFLLDTQIRNKYYRSTIVGPFKFIFVKFYWFLYSIFSKTYWKSRSLLSKIYWPARVTLSKLKYFGRLIFNLFRF